MCRGLPQDTPEVDNQQAAELYRALAALDLVRRSPQPHVQLVLDNMGAIAQILWGRAKSSLCPQHRILRRLAHNTCHSRCRQVSQKFSAGVGRCQAVG